MNKKTTESRLIPGIGRVPFPAYRGHGRYIFISYAHKDKHLVFPEIIRFQDMGYNIWYDEGISPGNEWKDDIAEHLLNSDLFIIFISHKSVISKNCRKEFYCALSNNIPIIPFYLEDFDTIDIDDEWKVDLSEIQGILMKNFIDEEEYVFKFSEAFRYFGFEIFNFSKDFIEKILYESELNSSMKLANIQEPIENFFNNLYVCENSAKASYVSIFKSDIETFIHNPGPYFANNIYLDFINLYEMIIKINQKSSINANTVRYFYKALKKHDKKQFRQNFVHSVNVFILGLAVYSENISFRKCFEDYLLNSGFNPYENQIHEEFFIRWAIASLFHDCCFTIEAMEKNNKNNIYKELKPFLEYDSNSLMKGINEFNILQKSIIGEIDVDSSSTALEEEGDLSPIALYNCHDILKLEYDRNIDIFKPTDILALKIASDLKLNDDNLHQLQNNLVLFLNYASENDFDEHGVLASILILNCFSCLDYENSFLQIDHFYYSVLDSASAILLHNYYNFILQEEPFNFKQLKPLQIPLAYLLILCDEIVETSIDNIYFEISENIIAEYNLTSGSYGFGFHDKEKLLKHVLDFSDWEINLRKTISYDSYFEIKKQYFEDRYIEPPIHLVEKISREIHRVDIERYGYGDYEEFDENPELRKSLIEMVKRVLKSYYFLRYDIVNVLDLRPPVETLSETELDECGRFEYENYCDEKNAAGILYVSDERILKLYENRTYKTMTEILVPWNHLNQDKQSRSLRTIMSLPSVLKNINLKVVKSKYNLLALELYNFICILVADDSSFESLPSNVQESYHQRITLIDKILFEIDYSIVDKNDNRESVDFLDDKESDYFIEEFNREYVKFIRNLGLEGKPVDSVGYAHTIPAAKEIIREISRLCKKVGLKIVKTK